MFLTNDNPLQIFCLKPAKRELNQKKANISLYHKEMKHQSSTDIFENEEVKWSMLWFEGEEEMQLT